MRGRCCHDCHGSLVVVDINGTPGKIAKTAKTENGPEG